jgi:hypothetical protein
LDWNLKPRTLEAIEFHLLEGEASCLWKANLMWTFDVT